MTGEPTVPASHVHYGTVRKGRDGYWWIARDTVWKQLSAPAKTRKTRKAGKASVAWAAKTGMIKVFFSKPESCNSTRLCTIPEVDLGSWYYGQLLFPYSPKHKYQYVYEYMGPLADMDAAQKKLEKHFLTLKKNRIISGFDMQVNSMLEKYKSWGEL